ncbi:hypothetical protein BV20DRAFT_969937 [Pilatotrama ljubarskyi]|nr:hypothetical protein BV20DRAFT_969937 [Pilatotrama ljubarskyi]
MSNRVGTPAQLGKRKQRDLSPVIPDPEELTPGTRTDAFGTPARSARVYRTYAHKRARSRANSSAGDEPLEVEAESLPHVPSPQESPTRVQYGTNQAEAALGADLPRGDLRDQDRQEETSRAAALMDHHSAYNELDPSTSFATQRTARSKTPLRRRRSTVFVEIPSQPASQLQKYVQPLLSSQEAEHTNAADVQTRVGRPRGRPLKQKPIAIPSPPPTSDDASPAGRPGGRRRAQSGTHLSLTDALNQSFAAAALTASTSATGFAEPSSEPPRRRRGRPPGRGRARVALGPVITHSELRSTRSRRTSDVPPVEPSRPPAQATAAKRGPGRPRKHPLPPGASSSPAKARSASRTNRRASTSNSRPALAGSDAEDSEEEAVTRQLLRNTSRADGPTTSSPSKEYRFVYQSVDVGPLARALERQAAEEAVNGTATETENASAGPSKKPRGRPRGSKNKTTLAREEAAARVRGLGSTSSAVHSYSAGPSAPTRMRATDPSLTSDLPPVPIKRPRGRPRKSAPSAFPASGFMDYVELLRDASDTEDRASAGPSSAGVGRGRSRTRRNSTSAVPIAPQSAAAPVAPPPYYLDLKTMQWKRRSRSLSASPSKTNSKRKASTSRLRDDATPAKEYQTSAVLCDALKVALLTSTPKLSSPTIRGKGKGKAVARTDDGLKVAPSGVLLFADGLDEGEEDDSGPWTCVFKGSWVVLGDPNATLDDALVLKKLHEVVLGTGAYVRSAFCTSTSTSAARESYKR